MAPRSAPSLVPVRLLCLSAASCSCASQHAPLPSHWQHACGSHDAPTPCERRSRLSSCPLWPRLAALTLARPSSAAASAWCCLGFCLHLLHSFLTALSKLHQRLRRSTVVRTALLRSGVPFCCHISPICHQRPRAAARPARCGASRCAPCLHGVCFLRRFTVILYGISTYRIRSLSLKTELKHIGPRASRAYVSSLCRRWVPTAS